MKKLYFLFAIALAAGTLTAQKQASELGKKKKYAAFETVAKKLRITNQKELPFGQTIFPIARNGPMIIPLPRSLTGLLLLRQIPFL